MLKIKKLQKQRTARLTELKQLRARRKKLRADEAALEQQIDEAEDISPEAPPCTGAAPQAAAEPPTPPWACTRAPNGIALPLTRGQACEDS